MAEIDIYKQVGARFYDEQLNSRNPIRRWFHHNRYGIINSLVKSAYAPSMKIIDIGAGSCNWNEDKLPVYGVDYNENLLSEGKGQGRLVDYRVANIRKTNFTNETFDIAVATEVLEHIEDAIALIKEIYRILNPRGVFVISVPYGKIFGLWNILFSAQVFYKGYILGEPYYRKRCGHLHDFTPESLSELVKSSGFEIDTEFSMWKLTIFLVARKGIATALTL